MARTYRRGNTERHHDGKAQTMRGLDKCPPRGFRTELHRRERVAVRIWTALRDPDASLCPTLRRPWFT